MSMDYELLEGKVTVLIVKDHASGAVLAYACSAKGPADQWVVRQFTRDLYDWGRRDICLKTDGEPAMIALQTAIADARASRTVPRNPLAYNCNPMAVLKRLSRTWQGRCDDSPWRLRLDCSSGFLQSCQ